MLPEFNTPGVGDGTRGTNMEKNTLRFDHTYCPTGPGVLRLVLGCVLHGACSACLRHRPDTPIWLAPQVSVAAASGRSTHVKKKRVSCQGGVVARSKAPATVLVVGVVAGQGI